MSNHNIIAHEMGHAINIPHHGEAPGQMYKGHKYFPEKGLSSGEPDCVMRLFGVGDGWFSEKNGKTVLHRTYTDPKTGKRLDHTGTNYCATKLGSGVNQDKGVTNDAAAGECRNRIRVKDW